MKRIVHLIFTLESGGSENLLVDIANEQASEANVTVILINNKSNQDLLARINNNVRFITLNRTEGNKRSIYFLIKLWNLLLHLKPDVIHCHNHNIILLLPLHRKKAVLTIHCLHAPAIHLAKYKQVYSVSNAVSDDIRMRTGIASPVILNGINFTHIFQRNNYDLRKSSVIKLVQVGRLFHEIKGQHLLLKALQQLLTEEKYSNLTVDIIGSGPSLKYLQKLTGILNINKHVCFAGEKSRTWIYNNLSSYHILIQPSLSEGFGLSVLEGVAAGLPVIASDHAGPCEILQQLPTGFLFKRGDVNNLVTTIKKVIDQLLQYRVKELCLASRKIADEKYSVHKTAGAYMRQYARLANDDR